MKKYQSGFSMVEMIMALAIMGVVIAGSARMTEQYMGDTKNQIAAKQLQDVIAASKQYIKDNYAAVVATATPVSPATITVATLVSDNYLPSGFSATNAFGQTMETRALEPVANQITAVTVTSGGTAINDIDLGSIAASIGSMGGSVRSTSSTTLTGAMGGWSIPLADYGVTPGEGHLGGAIWFDVNGGVVSDYLYRNAVPGHPEANRMNTVLDMGGFRVTALQSIAVIGSACAAPIVTGDMAQGPNGEILSCQAGTWKTQGGGYWKDPVASYAALPSTGNSTGDTRIVTGLARPAAFTWTGSAWSALSIDQNGNLSVPGTLSVTGATTLSSATISGTATIANLAGNLQVTATAAEGAACTGEGRIAASTTTSGLILSCQSGVWKKQSSGGIAGIAEITAQDRYTAKILATPCSYGGNWYTNFQRYKITTAGVLTKEASDYCSAPAGTVVQAFNYGVVAMNGTYGYGVSIGGSWGAHVSSAGVLESNAQFSGSGSGSVLYPWQ